MTTLINALSWQNPAPNLFKLEASFNGGLFLYDPSTGLHRWQRKQQRSNSKTQSEGSRVGRELAKKKKKEKKEVEADQ